VKFPGDLLKQPLLPPSAVSPPLHSAQFSLCSTLWSRRQGRSQKERLSPQTLLQSALWLLQQIPISLLFFDLVFLSVLLVPGAFLEGASGVAWWVRNESVGFLWDPADADAPAAAAAASASAAPASAAAESESPSSWEAHSSPAAQAFPSLVAAADTSAAP